MFVSTLCHDQQAIFYRSLGAECEHLGIAYTAFDIAAATLWQFTVCVVWCVWACGWVWVWVWCGVVWVWCGVGMCARVRARVCVCVVTLVWAESWADTGGG